jgi:hypothetical protein
LTSLTTSLTTKRLYQRTIPLFLIAVIAGIMIVEYFAVPTVVLTSVKNELVAWGVNMSAIALVFAQVMLLLRYGRTITRGRTGEASSNRRLFESGVFFGGFVIFGLIAFSTPQNVSGDLFTALYLAFVMKFAQGLGSCGWPAQVNAVFRSFRVTSLETLTITSVYILVWLRYLTTFTAFVPGIVPVFTWIEAVPHTAAQRAGLIGAAIGAMVIGVRALIGREPGLMEYEAA